MQLEHDIRYAAVALRTCAVGACPGLSAVHDIVMIIHRQHATVGISRLSYSEKALNPRVASSPDAR